MSSVLQHSTRFRAEADMLQPLSNAAGQLLRNPTILFEVPCAAGIPDIVLLALDRAAVQERAETTPLLDQVDVRLMVSLSNVRNALRRAWTTEELAEHAGVSSTHLRRSIIPRLTAGGHLHEHGVRLSLNYRYRSLAKKVVTVEAKLRDWRGAVGQAARHTAVADAAWVALDRASTRTAAENPDWFTTYGLGLLSVGTDGAVEKIIAPGLGRARQPSRELLVERAVALHQEGKHSGQIPRVFGATLLATTGDDPRLVGAGVR